MPEHSGEMRHFLKFHQNPISTVLRCRTKWMDEQTNKQTDQFIVLPLFAWFHPGGQQKHHEWKCCGKSIVFTRSLPCLEYMWRAASLTCWSQSGWEPRGCRSRTGWASGGGCSGSAGAPGRHHSAGPSRAADSAGCTAAGRNSAGAAAYSSGPDGRGLAGSGGSVSAGSAVDGGQGGWGQQEGRE